MSGSANHEIKENIRKAYNDIADKYLEWTEPTHKTRLTYLNLLLDSLNSNAKHVLELGCGAGVPCTQILAKKFDVTANDISDSQIALAKTRLPDDSVTLIHGDMMGLKFQTEFDAVLAMYSIIHLPREEQSEMLRRIWGWLRPGGVFLGNFLEGGFEGDVKGGLVGGVMMGEEIRRILGEIGFKIEVDDVVVDVEVEEDGREKEVAFHWILARKVE
ncbi:uncharacterized protein N7469_011113 [Penicillium citrinum]|uniref:Methyltransferase domain-containing protein n=1 Tax=Penicillium citrinum TaxID=5077 RepID=A0A9W9TCB6_PENCI|nr:uncharacterized protein N7469_011113 [Penicillium citrinum]KAJ5217488.1 hypothetical protein N7469_011113 [Penicillium citrinum]